MDLSRFINRHPIVFAIILGGVYCIILLFSIYIDYVMTENETKTCDVQSESIPRTHAGVTLGMPWSQAKTILENSNLDEYIHERKLDLYGAVVYFYSCDLISAFHASDELKDKYQHLTFVVFDGKVKDIIIIPQNDMEVRDALLKKYPFEKTTKDVTHATSVYGIPQIINAYYSYTDGKTEILTGIVPGIYEIIYTDVVLYKAFRDAVTKGEMNHENDVRNQMSDY